MASPSSAGFAPRRRDSIYSLIPTFILAEAGLGLLGLAGLGALALAG